MNDHSISPSLSDASTSNQSNNIENAPKFSVKTLLVAIFLILSLFIIIYFIYYIISAAASLPKEILAVIITVFGTAIVSLTTLVVTKIYERKKEEEKSIREKKIEVYSNFVKGIFNTFLFADQNDDKPSEKDQKKILQNFTTDIIMWGSDDVISNWNKFRNFVVEQPSNVVENNVELIKSQKDKNF